MARLGIMVYLLPLTTQSSSQIMASITGMIPAESLVLRDGQQKRVPASELVVGDIIYIHLGNKCPADFRIIECSGDLKMDRSVLTGESEPVAATVENTDLNFMETRNIGMQGTHVVSGSGVGVVIQTGDNTVFGRIAKLSAGGSGGLTTLQKVHIQCTALILGNPPICYHHRKYCALACRFRRHSLGRLGSKKLSRLLGYHTTPRQRNKCLDRRHP